MRARKDDLACLLGYPQNLMPNAIELVACEGMGE